MSDNWETPHEIFAALNAEFRFGFDVCAEHNTAKIPHYWTVEDDALSRDWSDAPNFYGEWLFCNPPYSKIMPWIQKAVDAQFNGVGTVMLVMCDPSVAWFSAAQSFASEIRFITNGRLAFLKDGVPQKGNNKGSVIFVFDPHRIGTGFTSYVDRDALMSKGQRLLNREAA